MSAYSTANVEAAVVQFYGGQGNNPSTHSWLTSAQMSPDAWSFSFELIDPSKKPEVQFFGASTLAVKVGRFWPEVPDDQYEALRKRVIDLAMAYGGGGGGAHVVMTRLCVALADLAIHSIPAKWPNPVRDLVSAFSSMEMLLFELLTVIPEEFSTLAMPSQKRAQVRAELANSLAFVLPLILAVLERERQQQAAAVQAVKALQAWVQFGVPMDVMAPIIKRLLAAVRDEELFDCSLDALSSIVSHPDTHKHVNLLRSLLEQILTLQPMLAQFVAEGAFEMAQPLVCLYVTFGESHSRMLIDWSTADPAGKELTLQLLRCILAVSSVNAQFPVQETISEMPFGFWYIFQDDILGTSPPQHQQCVATFGPVYGSLVDSLLRKAMYNVKESEWTPDQRESFRCYRTDVADTIMYCFNILRNELLASLLRHVDEAATRCQRDPSTQWPYLEASLYVWSAVAESLADEEDDDCPALAQFLAKLPGLPYNNNMRVISSALDCIGGFAEWLAMHPGLLPHVAPIVTTALQEPELSMCASMALKDMSRDCSEGMRPYADEVIDACHRALASGRLRPPECVRLMYSVGRMLALVPEHQVAPRLNNLLSPYVAELEALGSQPPSPQAKPRVEFLLKLLSMLFQSQEGGGARRPLKRLFPQVYPLLKPLPERWIGDPEVIETFCQLLTQCASTVPDELRPFAQDVVALLAGCFEAAPHSCILDVARNLFVLYARDDAMRPTMNEFFRRLVGRTMKEMASASNPSDRSELIAVFFCVAAQVLKKSPGTVDGADLGGMFGAACGCLGMPENGPVKYAAMFLAQFVAAAAELQPLSAVVDQHGSNLFLTVVRCVAGEASRSFVEHYVDVLFALNKRRFDGLRMWLQEMVAADGFPTANVTKEQKQGFANAVLRERANKRKLLEITREFSMVCCGLIDNSMMQMGQVMAAWDKIGAKEEAKAEAKAAAASGTNVC